MFFVAESFRNEFASEIHERYRCGGLSGHSSASHAPAMPKCLRPTRETSFFTREWVKSQSHQIRQKSVTDMPYLPKKMWQVKLHRQSCLNRGFISGFNVGVHKVLMTFGCSIGLGPISLLMSYRVVREPFGANWEEWVALGFSHTFTR